jgi:hypothetical protein
MFRLLSILNINHVANNANNFKARHVLLIVKKTPNLNIGIMEYCSLKNVSIKMLFRAKDF